MRVGVEPEGNRFAFKWARYDTEQGKGDIYLLEEGGMPVPWTFLALPFGHGCVNCESQAGGSAIRTTGTENVLQFEVSEVCSGCARVSVCKVKVGRLNLFGVKVNARPVGHWR